MKRGLTSVVVALLVGGVVVFLAIRIRAWDDRIKTLKSECIELRSNALIAKMSLRGRERKVNEALEKMGAILHNLSDSLRVVRKALNARDEQTALEFREVERDLRPLKTSLKGVLSEVKKASADIGDMKPTVDRMKGLSLQLESAFRRGQ